MTASCAAARRSTAANLLAASRPRLCDPHVPQATTATRPTRPTRTAWRPPPRATTTPWGRSTCSCATGRPTETRRCCTSRRRTFGRRPPPTPLPSSRVSRHARTHLPPSCSPRRTARDCALGGRRVTSLTAWCRDCRWRQRRVGVAVVAAGRPAQAPGRRQQVPRGRAVGARSGCLLGGLPLGTQPPRRAW